MADVIIRKAKKDYVCDVCGHIIKEGEEYLDKVILHSGKAVRHERYHDECPAVTDSEKLFRKIVESNWDLPCVNTTGTKFHAVGISHNRVVLTDWVTRADAGTVDVTRFYNRWIWE